MKLFKNTICVILAALTIILCAVSLYGCSDSSGNNANLDYAKTKVENYVEWQSKYNAEFYDEVYSKPYMAALSYTPKKTADDLQQIARYLFVDSIIVTNSDGKVVAEYPSKYKGKNIGDIPELVKFKSILKWVCPKCATDPEKVKDSDKYSMTLGVQRSDDGGCVVVSLQTDAYAKVIGSNLADECGPNVVIVKDKKVISSTMGDVKAGKTLKELKVSDNDLKADSFILSAGKNSYTCKAAAVDNFTVICGQ